MAIAVLAPTIATRVRSGESRAAHGRQRSVASGRYPRRARRDQEASGDPEAACSLPTRPEPSDQRKLPVRNHRLALQGGGISRVPTDVPGSGARSLGRTTGATSDEGWFSSRSSRRQGRPGPTVWLEGAHGGEQVKSRSEYNDREQAIDRAELPVVLTDPEQYAVKTTITDPEVTHIRGSCGQRSRRASTSPAIGHAAPDHESCCRQDRRDHDLELRRRHPIADDPGDRQILGDNQTKCAVTGPNLSQRQLRGKRRLGKVQTRADRSRVQPVARPEQQTAEEKGDDERRGLLLRPVRVEPGQTVSFSVWLKGSQGARRTSSACGSTRAGRSRRRSGISTSP